MYFWKMYNSLYLQEWQSKPLNIYRLVDETSLKSAWWIRRSQRKNGTYERSGWKNISNCHMQGKPWNHQHFCKCPFASCQSECQLSRCPTFFMFFFSRKNFDLYTTQRLYRKKTTLPRGPTWPDFAEFHKTESSSDAAHWGMILPVAVGVTDGPQKNMWSVWLVQKQCSIYAPMNRRFQMRI